MEGQIPMAITCTNYDAWIAQWHEELYRFCLVLTLDTKTAEEMTFQAYLRLGACPPGMDKASARTALYTAAFGVCRAHYHKKLRRRPSKKALAALLGTKEGEAPFIAYLRRPFLCKAAAFLLHIAAFSPDEAAKILHVGLRRATRLGDVPDMAGVRAACFALRRDEAAQEDLGDRLYLRFAERSVAFETRMLDMRHGFDRVAPYLALAVLVLFACALAYSLAVNGPM